MAFVSRSSTELLLPKDKWDEKSEIKCPQRGNKSSDTRRKLVGDSDGFALAGKVVPVVYYLSRNGKLEHPHFIQVSLSSSHGLYLRDVINRLNFLRGNCMAYKYSWSSKRRYKSNGFVWQDLSEDDLIHPTNDHDYVLKGSEILQNTLSFRLQREITPPKTETHCDNSSIMSRTLRNSHSFRDSENSKNHYQAEDRVYKCKSSRELGEELTDVATQTDDGGRRWRMKEEYGNKRVELSREELSPPPSATSSEGFDGVRPAADFRPFNQTAGNECSSWRIKASQRLMQLISCGSSDSIRCCSSIENLRHKEFLKRLQFGTGRGGHKLRL